MHCGRVSPLSTRPSFETLATLFEGSGPSGAERAYRRALEKLTLELARLGVIHCVRFLQKSVRRAGKEITAATYEYLADHDGDWGTIRFDFAAHTAEVVAFSKRDTEEHPTWAVEDAVIGAVWESEKAGLVRSGFLAVEREHF